MTNKKRLSLLPEAEVDELYKRPEFNQDEREVYFELSSDELIVLEQLTTIKTKIYFILQLGYFKAKHQFFRFSLQSIQDDANYVKSKYFNDDNIVLEGSIARNSLVIQKKLILNLFHFTDWSNDVAPIVQNHICELLRFYPKGHDTLRQLLAYLDNKQIIIPRYRILQDLFTSAFKAEGERLTQKLNLMPEKRKQQLRSLLEKEGHFSKLNNIRTDQKDFQYTALQAEINKITSIKELYVFSKSFIPSLDISKNAVRYYADLVEQYQPSRIKKLSQSQQWLQIICFIYHRYQQMMDNLITSFIYHIRNIIDKSREYANKAAMDYGAKMVVEMPKVAQFLSWYPTRDRTLTHDELDKQGYSILPATQFPMLADYIRGKAFDKKYAVWEYFSKSSRMISLYLRPIILNVPLIFYKSDHFIVKLIDVIKNHYQQGRQPSALKLSEDVLSKIPAKLQSYLKIGNDKNTINPHLFEFYVYRKVYRYLEKGQLCCNESMTYCDIDNDLVDEKLVDSVETIANDFGYPVIPLFCDDHLDKHVNSLDQTWDHVMKRIESGQNLNFIIKDNSEGGVAWSLSYESKEEFQGSFFDNLPPIELTDLIMFIGNYANAWTAFEHMKTRYKKRMSPDILAVNAVVLAEAFGISIETMSEISDINYNLLRSTRQDFIHVGSLCSANNIFSDLIHGLPIFQLWDLIKNKTLADADGQKMPTKEYTLQSRYSKKYLGKDPGISIYTLVANNVAVNAKNIGLNEYEGHALYDILYGNETNIDIAMVTGDNHSMNQLNFIFLDSINVDYVPSIKNIREAAKNLYSVKPINNYTGIIQPKGTINVNRIKKNKRGILRVLLSLLLQENTQTTIVKKLNSHARYNELKSALFEYNKIMSSKHVLNLIDDISLRQAIRTARNRTESYHQLQSLIRKVHHGVFKGRKVTSNRISAHATRLVANGIIAYNSLILNAVYEKMMKAGVNEEILLKFARISPIAWSHIAFTGKYNFKKSHENIDVMELAEILASYIESNLD